MSILEMIVIILFLLLIVSLAVSGVWLITVYPILQHCVYRKSNRLQWRCDETYKSREARLNKEREDYECDVYYKIMDEDLSLFTRIFGNNVWHEPFNRTFTFKSKDEFIRLVDAFKTYEDIDNWVNKENGVLWYHP